MSMILVEEILIVIIVIFYAIRFRKSVIKRVMKNNVDRSMAFAEILALIIIIMQLAGYDYFIYQAPITVSYVGLALAIAGAVFASTARIQLKSNYVPAPAASLPENLTTYGLYKIIRHPSYLGSLIAIIGFELAMKSYWMVLAVFILAIIIQQIDKEEKMLSEHYKDEWRRYIKATPYKLFPFVY